MAKIKQLGLLLLLGVLLCVSNFCAGAGLGADCAADDNCTTAHSVCDQLVCACASGYVNESTDTCRAEYNTTCTTDDDCAGNIEGLTECSSDATSVCTCNTSVAFHSTTDDKCVAKSDLDGPCTTAATDCEDADTVCTGNQCTCNDQTYPYAGSCHAKVSLEGDCPTNLPNTEVCADSNARCSGGTCLCISTYYDNKLTTPNRQCTSKVSLEGDCPTNLPNTEVCADSNARCSGGTCLCISTYYDNKLTTPNRQCISKVSLGGVCPTNLLDTEVCADSNARCSSGGTCLCTATYYDNLNRQCIPMTNLRVKNIVMSGVQTSQVTVTWNPPAQAQFVTKYTVEWSTTGNPAGDTGSKEPTEPTGTSVVVTGLTPGQAYIFKVISVHSTSSSTFVEEQQATKPNAPGPFQLGSSDLDAQLGSIEVAWSAATGGVTSGYTIRLFDGGSVIASTPHGAITGTSTTLNSSEIKNGYDYTLEIVARSRVYSGSKYEESEPYRVNIKTVVQKPTAPTSVTCGTTTTAEIPLSWQAPAFPNGVLQHYEIQVYIYNGGHRVKTVITTTTSTDFTVDGLSPGSDYYFRVYAVNELYTSDTGGRSPSPYCGTRAQMSDAPENITISSVTSRSFTVTWEKPANTYGELLGYVLQVYNADTACVKQYIAQCQATSSGNSCSRSFPNSLPGQCSSGSSLEILGKTTIDSPFSKTIQDLLPDTLYSIKLVAVNAEGKGREAVNTTRTLEEAPSMPTNVGVKDIQTTSFIVTWEMTGPRPGDTSYTVNVHAEPPAVSKEIVVTGFDTRQASVTGLEEYWLYTVTVTATTLVGNKTTVPLVDFRTFAAAPGKVSEFTTLTGDDDGANLRNYQRVTVKWQAPTVLERNSIIDYYTFIHNGTNASTTPTVIQASEVLWFEEIITVVPENTYSLEVYATNEGGQHGTPTIHSLLAPAGVPKNTIEAATVPVIPAEKLAEVKERSFRINIVRDFMEQSFNGEIRDSGLVGCAEDMCNAKDVKFDTLEQFGQMPNWNDASVDGYTMYRMTKPNFPQEVPTAGRRRRSSYTEIEYVVGVEICDPASTQFCNGPLQPATGYIVRVVTCSSAGCLISKPYGPFITLAVPDDAPIAAIIGGICGGLVVIAAVALIAFFVMRHKRRKPTTYIHKDRPSVIDMDSTAIARKRPVILHEFPTHVEKMHKDSNLLFSYEYAEDLKALSPDHPQEAANAEPNRLKNRYINILPFDHTRVKLLTQNEEDSDYINANYLPGYKSPREYIGCQGPIPGTVDDFWRMVWEQNVSVIVILTLCQEGNKVKCEQYWPDKPAEPKQYGDIVVEVQSYSSIKTYDYRIFKLQLGNQTRTVKHFHFLSWLDFQANVQHSIILDFITHVRSHVQPPDTAGPTIVHCSAGVGRTGTYTILDHLMQYIEEHDFDVSIDIFDMVLKLRENRPSMVQTEQQYIFIHDCVLEIMERKRTRLAENDNLYVNQAFSKEDEEENLYQNARPGDGLYANVQLKTEL